VASLCQGRTAAAQCGLFTHKSVPVIFEPPCTYGFCLCFQLRIRKGAIYLRNQKPALIIFQLLYRTENPVLNLVITSEEIYSFTGSFNGL